MLSLREDGHIFLLNQLVEIEDFPVDVPKSHLLLERYVKDRVLTALWLL